MKLTRHSSLTTRHPKAFTLLEIMIAVAVLARRFRFRLVPGRAIEPIAWTNLHPKGGIRMTVEPREAVPHAG